jgi:hypothetical protein
MPPCSASFTAESPFGFRNAHLRQTGRDVPHARRRLRTAAIASATNASPD